MAASITAWVADLHADPSLFALVDSRFGVGRLFLKENRAPASVAWVPIGGEIGPTDDVGGRLDGTLRRRQVRTRLQAFQVHIWGNDVANAEDIMDQLIAAGWRLNVGSIAFGAFEWFTQQSATADWAQFGEKVVLECTVKYPIHENELSLTTINSQENVTTFISPITGTPETICQ